MTTGGKKHDRYAVARVLIVVASAVILLGMTIGVVLIVEVEGGGLRLRHRFDEITELAGQPTRADQLQVPRPATFHIVGMAPPDHVHVQLSDNRIARNRWMIREVLRSPEALLFAGVPYEKNGALGLHSGADQRFGDLEECDTARSVVVGAVVDRVATGSVKATQAVEDGPDARHLRRARGTRRIILTAGTHDSVECAQ